MTIRKVNIVGILWLLIFISSCQSSSSFEPLLNELDTTDLESPNTATTITPEVFLPPAEDGLGEEPVDDILVVKGRVPCPGMTDIPVFFEWQGNHLLVDELGTTDVDSRLMTSEYFWFNANDLLQNSQQPVYLEIPVMVENKWPALSPDGLTVAYLSNRPPDQEVVSNTMRYLYLDRAGEISLFAQIDNLKQQYTWLRWNADGTKIAIRLRDQMSQNSLEIISLNGETLFRFDHPENGAGWDWHPDGRSLAVLTREIEYLSSIGERAEGVTTISLIDLPGNMWEPLVELPTPCLEFLQWSPDGQKLAWSMVLDPYDPTNKHDIYLMDVNSREIIKLTDGQTHHILPVWSPDNQKIAYTARRAGQHPRSSSWNWVTDICIVDIDGSDNRCFPTPPKEIRTWPVWSPDGKWLAFSAENEDERYIGAINLETDEFVKMVVLPRCPTEYWCP